MSIDDSRRKFLQTSGLGIGWLAALDLFQRAGVGEHAESAAPEDAAAAGDRQARDLAVHAGRSEPGRHVRSEAAAEQAPRPASAGQLRRRGFPERQVHGTWSILGSKRTFKKYGAIRPRSIGSVSAHCAAGRRPRRDSLLLSRRLHAFAGAVPDQQRWPRIGRPSLGSWILYGLGSENQNLPGFVVLLEGGVRSGPAVYGQGFLPAAYQGTSFRPGRNPILNLSRPAGMKRRSSATCSTRCAR